MASTLANQSILGENSIVISQIINMMKGISFDSRNKVKSLIGIFCLFPKILLLLGFKHLVSNTDGLSVLMIGYIKRLLYRKEEHLISDTDGIGRYLISILNRTGIYNWTSFRFDIVINNGGALLYTLRFLPKSPQYLKLTEQAKTDKKIRTSTAANCKKLVYENRFTQKPISPNIMFPSNNYIHLADMINKSIDTSDKLGHYQTIPILINGEPGLGKSKSLDYIAYNTKVKDIIKVDLATYINSKVTLSAIFDSLMTLGVSGHTVIIIDELDKYISSVCQANETPEKINDELLNHVLSLIESESSGPYCIYLIFCSNNFDTIFDYISDDRKIHYESLKDRFLKLIFHRLDKPEFTRYIQWLAEKTESNIDEKWLDNIPEDFSITSRDLKNTCLLRLYDIESICKSVRSSPKSKTIIAKISRPIVGHKYQDDSQMKTLVASCYHQPDIILTLFAKNSKYVDVYVEFITNHDAARSITPEILAVIKKHKTMFAYYIYLYYRDLKIGHKLLSEFDDPDTISIREWFELPSVTSVINGMRNAIKQLDHMLEYSYTRNHKFPIGIDKSKLNDSEKLIFDNFMLAISK